MITASLPKAHKEWIAANTITASKLSTASVTSTSRSSSSISKKWAFKTLLWNLKTRAKASQSSWALFRKRKGFLSISSDLEDLLKQCQRTKEFEGQTELLLEISIFKVKLKQIMSKCIF